MNTIYCKDACPRRLLSLTGALELTNSGWSRNTIEILTLTKIFIYNYCVYNKHPNKIKIM